MTSAAYLAFEPADEDAARLVAAALERNGWTPLLASPELRSSENLARLVETIGKAGIVIVFASAATQESRWLPREVAAAINNGRPMIVVRTGDLPPESWIYATLDTANSVDFQHGPQSEALNRIVELARAASGRGRVIAMLNIKGGVGKTVLAANLFAAAHLADKRSISFIDLDPQHNLTQYFLSPGERNRIRDRNHTLYGVLNPRGDSSLKPSDFGAIAV